MNWLNNYRNNLKTSNTFDHNPTFRVAQVVKIRYPDQEDNKTKNVLYDLLAFDNKGGTFPIVNARKMASFYSFNDYEETLLEANEVPIEGELSEANPPQNLNGSYVLVAFLDGNLSNAVIIGALQHPRMESQSTLENGIQSYRKFRGLKHTINKDGELEISYTGPSNPDGTPVYEEQVPITFKMGRTSETIEQEGHKFVFNVNEEDIKIGLTTKQGQSITINDTEDAEDITILHKSQSKIQLSQPGSILLQSSDGSKVLLDAESGEILVQHFDGADKVKISKDSIEIETAKAVTVKDSGGGTFKAAEGKVAVGTSAVEVLDQLATALENIAKVFDTMSQTAPTFVSTSVGPGVLDPGIVSELASAKASLDKAKSDIDSIKGSI